MWSLIGNPKAVTLLDRSITTGQLSHAYLFVGPPHVGKLTLAMSLAQAVNCQASGEVPCGECTACQRIAAGKHSDVQVIGALSDEKKGTSIDQVRDMEAAASLPPYEGRCKVFIFDRAETFSHEAANCLLKTLEEPSPRVLIILLSTTESGVLPTIASRCQQVDLRPLSVSSVTETLAQHHTVDQDRADLLARLSGGCLGWALLALQDDSLVETRSQRLTTLTGLRSADMAERFAYATELATRFGKNREEVQDILGLWRRWWHDLLLVKGGSSRFVTNVDRQEALLQQAEDLSTRQIVGFIHSLHDASRELGQNANPRLVLEVLMLSMP